MKLNFASGGLGSIKVGDFCIPLGSIEDVALGGGRKEVDVAKTRLEDNERKPNSPSLGVVGQGSVPQISGRSMLSASILCKTTVLVSHPFWKR